MTKPTPAAAFLVACALITTAVPMVQIYVAHDGALQEQADTVRITASAASNTASIYVVTNATTGDDYDVIAPESPRPTANSGA